MSGPTAASKMFPRGLLRPELYVGLLSSVTAQAAKFNIDDAGSPSGAHFLGGRYGKGEVGEFVLIEGQRNILLGRVVEIHLPDSDRRLIEVSRASLPELDGIGTIQMLGSVEMDTLAVTAGIESYPRLGDRVYAAPHAFIASLPRFMDAHRDEAQEVSLDLGSIDGAAETRVSIKPEKLFGRHCAILGATGGGKSWTTARVIEECLRHEAKIVLLDATGEYRGFDQESVANFHLGNPVEIASTSEPRSLPQTSFVETDFIAMFEPAGKSQGPKLKAAIRSLRLAHLEPSIATDGVVLKIDQPKADYLAAHGKKGIADRLEDPSQPFDVTKLAAQIAQECVWPTGGSAKFPDNTKWGGESGELAYCLTLTARISGVLMSPSFDCVFRSKEKKLTDELSAFVDNGKRLLRICLSGVSYEFQAREIIANVIGRHLLGMAREGRFKSRPLVVIVDEAHNFLGRQIGSEDSAARLDAFEMIAKEGRKYGLTICLSTQRPRDITEGVLSQIGTLIVHRLTNDRDREVVERACGEIDRSASSFLPNLKPGEAAIIGVDFPIPLTLQIRPPHTQPRSDGPDYQQHWRGATSKCDAAPGLASVK